jgi:hypothetical protein
MGTPGYISPEQSVGQSDVDARSDVYAIGATMFHMLTGHMAFPGESVQGILGRQIAGLPPQASEVNPEVPTWLSNVVAQALAADRRERFQSAAEMAEALRAGRRSGEQAGGIREYLVQQIREDDPTPNMVRAATGEIHPPWDRRSSRRRLAGPAGRTTLFSWSLYLGLAGATAGYFLLVPMTFTLRNNLMLPVELSIEDGVVRTIDPAGSLAIRFPEGGRLVGRWFGVQPTLDSGRTQAGQPVSGVIRIDGVTAAELLLRRVRRSIDSWTDGSVVFAPRVRNEGSRPVRVTVGRAGGQPQCNCPVGPGEERLLGYYRLESSSFVRVQSDPKHAVVFGNLESRIDLNTGVLPLMVNDTILSRSSQ